MCFSLRSLQIRRIARICSRLPTNRAGNYLRYPRRAEGGATIKPRVQTRINPREKGGGN